MLSNMGTMEIIDLSPDTGIDIDIEVCGDTGPDFQLFRDIRAMVNPDTIDINHINIRP